MNFKMTNDTPAKKFSYDVLPPELRSEIKGSKDWRKDVPGNNIGRKPTNSEYAKENGITKRQASKKRRGY